MQQVPKDWTNAGPTSRRLRGSSHATTKKVCRGVFILGFLVHIAYNMRARKGWGDTGEMLGQEHDLKHV